MVGSNTEAMTSQFIAGGDYAVCIMYSGTAVWILLSHVTVPIKPTAVRLSPSTLGSSLKANVRYPPGTLQLERGNMKDTVRLTPSDDCFDPKAIVMNGFDYTDGAAVADTVGDTANNGCNCKTSWTYLSNTYVFAHIIKRNHQLVILSVLLYVHDPLQQLIPPPPPAHSTPRNLPPRFN